jgi:hypothetical protein
MLATPAKALRNGELTLRPRAWGRALSLADEVARFERPAG